MEIQAQAPLAPSSQKAFSLFLAISLALHMGAFLYKKRHVVFMPSSTSKNFSQSLKVQIRETKVQQKVSKQQIKKVVKKKIVKKKAKRKVAPVKKEVLKEEPIKRKQVAASPKFDSVISSYTEPNYPRLAIRRGLTGKVNLALKVLGTGKISEVLITKSSGHDLLDNSVLEAAKSWIFKELSENPQAIYSITKTVVFKLN